MIRIASAEEFQRLLEALAFDIGNANIHWRLYRDLLAALGADPVVGNQSNTFWYLTLNAHSSTALQSLARAYDSNRRALHLHGWLKTIQANSHFFETSEFKKRLAGNPFADSLAEHPRMPDPKQLGEDIVLCSTTDPKVKSLVQHRGNIAAHRNAKATAAGQSLSEEFGISVEDFEALLDRAHHIVNRYSNLFVASTYSRQVVGHDDYRYIFKCVKDAVESSRSARGG
jgi:hypothetical protein